MSRTVVTAQRRAAELLSEGDWRSALNEYAAIVGPDPAAWSDRTAAVGIARALARGGHLGEAYLVLDLVMGRFTYSDTERANLVHLLRIEAATGDDGTQEGIGRIAAEAGLLTWRHSRWTGVYLALLAIMSGIPFVIGLRQEHYVSIVFGAVAGAALVALYVSRHRIPAWHAQHGRDEA